MPELKLHYFDMNAGRGEAPRVAMLIGGVAFEDRRIPFQEWPDAKSSMPYLRIPALEVDGQMLVESNAICRYVGKLAGLYPQDDLQAAFCDETLDVVEDLAARVVATFPIKDEEEKKAARKALAEGPIKTTYQGLAARLEARGGEYFADGRLTVADLKVFLQVRHLLSGQLDHVPTDLLETIAPTIMEHYKRVMEHPVVAARYAS